MKRYFGNGIFLLRERPSLYMTLLTTPLQLCCPINFPVDKLTWDSLGFAWTDIRNAALDLFLPLLFSYFVSIFRTYYQIRSSNSITRNLQCVVTSFPMLRYMDNAAHWREDYHLLFCWGILGTRSYTIHACSEEIFVNCYRVTVSQKCNLLYERLLICYCRSHHCSVKYRWRHRYSHEHDKYVYIEARITFRSLQDSVRRTRDGKNLCWPVKKSPDLPKQMSPRPTPLSHNATSHVLSPYYVLRFGRRIVPPLPLPLSPSVLAHPHPPLPLSSYTYLSSFSSCIILSNFFHETPTSENLTVFKTYFFEYSSLMTVALYSSSHWSNGPLPSHPYKNGIFSLI